MAKRTSDSSGESAADGSDRIQYVPISTETRRRYLNYAMSVITSRALPDVRDGLKPVQRRIMYVMYEGLGLTADSKPRKCAKISGDTTGNFHPHGNVPVYEALVRLAQDFTLRYPLVNGQGNFGSVMGLPPAAERYTEAKLTALAEQLMSEMRFDTVGMRPNYDGTREEPVVLPARYPNLLVNGASGIAVGMATNIPPHNLNEIIAACHHLIADWNADTAALMKSVKGPDFPLGGRMVTDQKELIPIYEEGRGSIKVRGECRTEKDRKTGTEDRLIVYSVPYGVETNPLVAEIGAVVQSRKLPQLLDVHDETDEKHGLRIVLELKPGADHDAVLAYLYKHTALEQNFAYNATCLVPDETGALIPARCNLADMLRHFLTFRLETVRTRTGYQLRQLENRLHILEGFAILFNDLDRALKIIRNSSGKRDACDKLMKAFPLLDEPQTMAILEIQLYRISQLEINSITGELEEKRAQAEKLRKLLASEKKLWNLVQSELQEISDQFGDKRRTALGKSKDIVEYDASAYIVRENTNVVVTREGWIKRVGRLQSVETTRVREGDMVLDVLPGSTLDTAVFFASDGVAYTLPITDIPPSSGYGDPLSKYVKMADGVQIISAVSTDARFTPADEEAGDQPPTPYLLVATHLGNVMQIPLGPFRLGSTKSGRKFCRLQEGDRVLTVQLVGDATSVFLASHKGRVIHFSLDEVALLSGAGRGVRGIKLDTGDHLVGLQLVVRPSDCLRIKTDGDKVLTCGQMKYALVSRGGKGDRAVTRSTVTEVIRDEISLVDWNTIEAERS